MSGKNADILVQISFDFLKRSCYANWLSRLTTTFILYGRTPTWLSSSSSFYWPTSFATSQSSLLKDSPISLPGASSSSDLASPWCRCSWFSISNLSKTTYSSNCNQIWHWNSCSSRLRRPNTCLYYIRLIANWNGNLHFYGASGLFWNILKKLMHSIFLRGICQCDTL